MKIGKQALIEFRLGSDTFDLVYFIALGLYMDAIIGANFLNEYQFDIIFRIKRILLSMMESQVDTVFSAEEGRGERRSPGHHRAQAQY
jgi:hypothetical protein